ncbi:MAG: PepSY domain-containing protein [Pseudomonadota bacterium]
MKQIITRIHLWTGLLLGLQVIAWMASGVIMSWFDIDTVTGRDRASPEKTVSIEDIETDISLDSVLADLPFTQSITFRKIADEPILEVTDSFDDVTLINMITGEPLIIGEAKALAIAKADYSGEWNGANIRLWDKPHYEIRSRDLPLWRVEVEDDRGTRLYVSSTEGKVVARRNDIWRLYDFFWMLHIMDYGERHDFNNPLLKIASATGLLFALSGIGLVFLRLRSQRYQNDLERLRTVTLRYRGKAPKRRS